MMQMTIRTEQSENQATVYVSGEVDAYTAPQLSGTLHPLVQSGENPLVAVDLAGVSYMDSTGIGIFVGALKMARQSGCRLQIQNVTPRLERLFRITGLYEIIPIVPTQREEA